MPQSRPDPDLLEALSRIGDQDRRRLLGHLFSPETAAAILSRAGETGAQD